MQSGFDKLGDLTAHLRRLHSATSGRGLIVHVSVSLFVDDVAVVEFVEPVKRLWSMLSWRDADCALDQACDVEQARHVRGDPYCLFFRTRHELRGAFRCSNYFLFLPRFFTVISILTLSGYSPFEVGSFVLVDIDFRLSRLSTTGSRSNVEFAQWAAAPERLLFKSNGHHPQNWL